MLQESAQQFEILDSQSDFSGYKVLILPDDVPCDSTLSGKIENYLKQGGHLIASYHSGLNDKGDSFNLKALGVRLKGEAPFSPDFIVPGAVLSRDLKPTEHVMYLKGLEVEAEGGCEVLADAVVPYFNRTYQHFCSHRHTPSSGKKGYPGVLRNGNAVYFAHPIFRQYDQNAPKWCKTLFLNALELLLPNPLVKHQGPSTLQVALNVQPNDKRLILHLLHYIPERRSQSFDTIEDVIPLYDVKIGVHAEQPIRSVRCVPEMTDLEFVLHCGRVEMTVPEIRGHQMIEIGY